jgi:hypothetical protein
MVYQLSNREIIDFETKNDNKKKENKPGPSKKACISETSCSFEISLIPSNGSDVISDISLITRLIT